MSTKTSVRVVLVDHHLLVRCGLRAILSDTPDIALIGEGSNGQEALHLCERLQPDVVVMELVMPLLDGVAATRLIRQCSPDTHILILTCSPDDERVEEVLRAGAVGYLKKNMSSEAFINSIREASQGVCTLAPEAARALIRMQNAPPEIGHDLTVREQEVLVLLANGMSNQEIATHYQISNSTVQFHVSNIFSKLGVSNRVEATAFAIRHNFV